MFPKKIPFGSHTLIVDFLPYPPCVLLSLISSLEARCRDSMKTLRYDEEDDDGDDCVVPSITGGGSIARSMGWGV